MLVECGDQSPADSSAHSLLFSATDLGADLRLAEGLDRLLPGKISNVSFFMLLLCEAAEVVILLYL
jgi:hypothetical protein